MAITGAKIQGIVAIKSDFQSLKPATGGILGGGAVPTLRSAFETLTMDVLNYGVNASWTLSMMAAGLAREVLFAKNRDASDTSIYSILIMSHVPGGTLTLTPDANPANNRTVGANGMELYGKELISKHLWFQNGFEDPALTLATLIGDPVGTKYQMFSPMSTPEIASAFFGGDVLLTRSFMQNLREQNGLA